MWTGAPLPLFIARTLQKVSPRAYRVTVRPRSVNTGGHVTTQTITPDGGWEQSGGMTAAGEETVKVSDTM